MRILVISLLLSLSACRPAMEEEAPVPVDNLEQLATFMQGSFRNEAQALSDSSFFDLSLEVRQIWPERTDGYWLYMEQALTAARENPFRQRVYHLAQAEGDTILLSVYAIAGSFQYAGAYNNDSILSSIQADSLQHKIGCHLYFTPQDAPQRYMGVNKPGSCEVQVKGVSYLMSEVTVFADSLYSWDRGYNDKDEVVWGANSGGYKFTRLQPLP